MAREQQQRALDAAFQAVIRSDTLPSLDSFLKLGRQLYESQLYDFIDEAVPCRQPPTAYLRGLLSAATRHHNAQLNAATRARVNDAGVVQEQLVLIGQGGWPSVRNELCEFYHAVREKLGRRLLPPGDGPAALNKPRWDGANRTLYFRGVSIKSYRKNKGERQTAIFQAFEQEGWPSVIPDPFNNKLLLSQTLKDLNAGMPLNTILFRGDGGGGVRWDPMPAQ